MSGPGDGLSNWDEYAQKWEEADATSLQASLAEILNDFRMSGTAYSDVFNAETMIQCYGAKLRHCREWRSWYVWDGTTWRKDRDGRIMGFARETVKWLGTQAFERGDEQLGKHAIRSLSDRSLTAMLGQASTMEPRRLPEDFDQHPWLLNCPNGTVDLRTARVAPNDPDLLITKCTAAPYDSESMCPTWEAFLWRIMGGSTGEDSPDDSEVELEARTEADDTARDLVAFLQRAIGYSLVGSTLEKILLIPYGAGDNGKSTFIETISGVLGPDYAMRTPTALFLSKGEHAIPNDVAQLKGIRFAYAAEAPQERRLDESLIKELTGGDTISARFMRGEFFSFQPECTLWMATNHKPQTRGTDQALWNRLKLVPFVAVIPPAEQDIHLREKLMEEAPGILAWAVRGCLAWQRQGLDTPQSIIDATSAYRQENDMMAQFLTDRCVRGPNYFVKSSQLYEAYKAWCEEMGERYPTQRAFSTSLKEKGFEIVKRNSMIVLDLGLAAD